MSLKRNVSLFTALQYKGQGPFITYILHRIGGLGMAIFIAMHVTASFLESQNLHLAARIGDLLNDIYINPFFQLFIFFCIFFHAINGLRIIILDLFPKLIKYYRQAIWLEWMFFLPIYGFAVFVIVSSELIAK